MGEIKQIKAVVIDKLIPYVNNAKKHSDDQVRNISRRIMQRLLRE